MRPDCDALKAPQSDEAELILADPDARRQRTLVLKRANLAKRRERVVKVDSYAREKLEDAAREIHGNVDVTPTLASNVLVGEEITFRGRRWIVGAVCARKSCAPDGWVHLAPVRVGINHGQTLPPPIQRKCEHQKPPSNREAETRLGPTVGAKFGDKDNGKPLLSFERAESLREQYVGQMFRKATAAWNAGDLARERVYTNLAQRADAMSDDEWLTNRKVILGR